MSTSTLFGLALAALASGGCGGSSREEPEEGAQSASDECVPYDDACATGTYCQYVDGRTQCVAEGDTPREELCNDSGRCQRGSICLYSSSYGDACQQPCALDGSVGCLVGRHTCFVAVGDSGEELPFGVCRYSE